MAADRKINVPLLLWRRLVGDLQRRGRGRRESGAFLLGRADSDELRVTQYLCYDDLDPSALASGIVVFHGNGYSALWAHCAKNGLSVLADVHTHPTSDVRQSYIDQDHPMVPVKGHVALILPRYGHTSKWSLSGTGIHLFQGQGVWQSRKPHSVDCPITLCMW